MKALYLLFICILTTAGSNAQSIKHPVPDSAKPFRLEFSRYNHADMFSSGQMIYTVTEKSITVTQNFSMLEKKKIVLFTKALSATQPSVIALSRLKLVSLHSYYFNSCVMSTSGDEYDLYYKNGKSSKSINLHHYYLKEVENAVNLINENLPEKYRISYVGKSTKQNCPDSFLRDTFEVKL